MMKHWTLHRGTVFFNAWEKTVEVLIFAHRHFIGLTWFKTLSRSVST